MTARIIQSSHRSGNRATQTLTTTNIQGRLGNVVDASDFVQKEHSLDLKTATDRAALISVRGNSPTVPSSGKRTAGAAGASSPELSRRWRRDGRAQVSYADRWPLRLPAVLRLQRWPPDLRTLHRLNQRLRRLSGREDILINFRARSIHALTRNSLPT